MANILRPRVQVNVTFEDIDGDKRTSGFHIPITEIADLQAAVTYGSGIANLMAACSTCRVADFGILAKVDIAPAFNEVGVGVPNPNSEASVKGVFVFETSEKTSFKLELPGINPILVNDFSHEINEQDPAVAALIAAILQGPPGANNGVVTGAGLQVARFVGAHKHVRRSPGK
jgi:hypothetical protein